MTAYYNEIDPKVAAWLRNLIEAGHIAPGIVDERSIEDVTPNDLRGFQQCHFFAGVGVWSHALRNAGVPDDNPVWTGSCPCQPFSSAGKGAGFNDPRHLWPAFHHLIRQCRPIQVLGEQVASKNTGVWIDLVQDNFEAMGYTFGAVPFAAACVGAPHIRDRLYWVANSNGELRDWGGVVGAGRRFEYSDGCAVGGLADHYSNGCESRREGCQAVGHRETIGADSGASILGNTDNTGLQERECVTGVFGGTIGGIEGQAAERAGIYAAPRHGPTNGFWADADWLLCRDGKWRPVKPGSFPLVAGASNRVVRLRAYGNSLNAKAAQAFIESVMECPPKSA